jgi:hypothetical protein
VTGELPLKAQEALVVTGLIEFIPDFPDDPFI